MKWNKTTKKKNQDGILVDVTRLWMKLYMDMYVTHQHIRLFRSVCVDFVNIYKNCNKKNVFKQQVN